MRTSRVATALLIAMAVTLTSGCAASPSTPTAAPSAPSSTPAETSAAPFATDDEAFAAAEESYRAYVDAINALDFSDPSTFTAAYDLTTDEEYRMDKKTYTRLHAEHSRVEGIAEITLLEPYELSSSRREASLIGCLAVANVALFNASGKDITSAERPDVQTLVVHLTAIDGKYRVAKVRNRVGGPACD